MESLEETLTAYACRLEAFEGRLKQIREALQALSETTPTAPQEASAANSTQEAVIELPPLEAAQLHVCTAFAACTLWFVYLKTQGLSTQCHPVTKDLARVQQYMHKVSRAIQEGEKRTQQVDVAAAGRMIAFHTANSKQDPRGTPQEAPKAQGRLRERRHTWEGRRQSKCVCTSSSDSGVWREPRSAWSFKEAHTGDAGDLQQRKHQPAATDAVDTSASRRYLVYMYPGAACSLVDDVGKDSGAGTARCVGGAVSLESAREQHLSEAATAVFYNAAKGFAKGKVERPLGRGWGSGHLRLNFAHLNFFPACVGIKSICSSSRDLKKAGKGAFNATTTAVHHAPQSDPDHGSLLKHSSTFAQFPSRSPAANLASEI
ncbi:uncharacterized protein LOC34622465 [Cyclospora cayetanensis]|uniref:Nuclear nucleic acid-binding protein C1D n=1 Tax=Cyclospora cayetanensis TaxID=88456 RepID=A0A6P6RY98_9EIME|nr:uncharacterized protein LOC34622465 [Cyclospora cayetanensis]